MTTALITTPTFGRFSDDPWQILAAAGTAAVRPYDDRALPGGELLERVPAADALIVGMDPVTAEVLDAGARLKVVAKHGVGVDTIDVAAARERGIRVVYAPGGNSRAVAELTFGLMLSAARQIGTAHTAVRAGSWPKLFGPELAGRTLGIVGFGRIGRLLAGYGHAFGMTVVAHDPHLPPGVFAEHHARPVELDACVSGSDFLSLHLPAEPGAPPLLDRTRLASMRAGACLVNAARGGLVDEDALADLLRSGHLGAAALDAFAAEPLGDSALRTAPNLVLTSHIGACSYEANRTMGVLVAEDVVRVLRGAEPRNEAA
ncbi:D-3-phosphoglycerate dehydrogenase [Murinocardiopsis flavida]|uniref:D-3-phosphoglycerate dehydrogenase n=1 Tax=Murinocardiopsis flavida TaxID=645275 RepID=A0A2P8DMI4_9ACTN|nr:phosphoglycerate dehydrogenase [Murinocardiopsis flavida]PSK98418.1 D-3-phosphoglycerate dehydrogenase [Murinocardiopsis flavida]